MRHLALPGLVLLAVLRPCGADDAPGRTKLAISGEARMESVRPFGEQDFSLQRLRVANPGDKPIEIRSANLLLAGRGGWLTPLDPESMDGSFLKGPWTMDPGAERVFFEKPMAFGASAPATYAVLLAQTDDGHAEVTFPILSEGMATPLPYQPPYPFGVGIAAPLEVVPYSDGQRSVMLIGQYQCLGGGKPDQVKTRVEVGDGSGALAPVTWEGTGESPDLTYLWPFVRRIDVPASFQGGLLRLHTEAVVDGSPAKFDAEWEVKPATPVELLGPVLAGAWHLGNGPGERKLHANYVNPEGRYGYDIVMVEQGLTYRGAPYKNESYFAWGHSVLAAADGKVIEMCDHEPDHPPGAEGGGYTVHSSVAPCRVNRIVIEGDDGVRTVYLHLKNASISRGVIPGERVRAGQVIAKIGNNGPSTEPHLHFFAYRVDTTGRPRPVPVTFRNAFFDAAGEKPVAGVPVGGSTVQFLEKK